MNQINEGAVIDLSFQVTIKSPVSATYRIINEEKREILPLTSVDINENIIEISIPGSLNVLIDDAAHSLFTVEVIALDADGNKDALLEKYIVARAIEFVIPTTSFQSMDSATLESLSIPNISEFEGAEDSDRLKAMIEAHWRLNQMRFNIWASKVDKQERITDALFTEEYYRLSEMTPDRFSSIDPRLLAAIKKAQIVEADDILGGNPIEKQRSDGLMSESVGESSQMYRVGKPVQLPVGRRALAYVSDWVVSSLKLGRG